MPKNSKPESTETKVASAIKNVCTQRLGVLDSGFMCQSISALQLKQPVCVHESDSVEKVVDLLVQRKTGCVLVLDSSEKLSGIFTERDLLLKVTKDYERLRAHPVSEFMTAHPVTHSPDDPIAYALNLMSQGGFRHLPVLDTNARPVGIISVKDVVDYIVRTFTEDVLGFEVSEE